MKRLKALGLLQIQLKRVFKIQAINIKFYNANENICAVKS